MAIVAEVGLEVGLEESLEEGLEEGLEEVTAAWTEIGEEHP